MGLLTAQFNSLLWHVVTGKYEVLPDMSLAKRHSSHLVDSSVPLLGKVPATWQLMRIKEVCNFVPTAWGDLNNEGVEVVRSTNITLDGTWLLEDIACCEIDQATKEACKLRAGDLVITKSSGSETHIGKAAQVTAELADREVLASNFMAVLRGATPNWLKVAWDGAGRAQADFLSTTTTGLKNLTETIIGRCSVPVPPTEEIDRIIRYLAKEQESYIQRKASLESALALAEQQFQSLVWHIVTGKYEVTEDGNLRKRKSTEMHASRVSWIGDLPVTWAVCRIKDAYTVINGGTPKSGTAGFWDGDIAWATPVDLQDTPVNLQDTQRTITQAGCKDAGLEILVPGGIVLSTRAPIGSLAIAQVPITFNQGCKGLIPRSDASVWELFAAKDVMRSKGNGSTFQELSTTGLLNLEIPKATKRECPLISAFLGNALKRYTTQRGALQDLL